MKKWVIDPIQEDETFAAFLKKGESSLETLYLVGVLFPGEKDRVLS